MLLGAIGQGLMRWLLRLKKDGPAWLGLATDCRTGLSQFSFLRQALFACANAPKADFDHLTLDAIFLCTRPKRFLERRKLQTVLYQQPAAFSALQLLCTASVPLGGQWRLYPGNCVNDVACV